MKGEIFGTFFFFLFAVPVFLRPSPWFILVRWYLCCSLFRKDWVKNCNERFGWRLDVAHLFYIFVLPLVALVVY